jgi:hypothetical protein
MRKVFTFIASGILATATITGSSAAATTLYSNGFETDTTDWTSATRVASGTGGISSAGGSFHAQSPTGTGNLTRWGGYNYGAGNAVPTTFQEYTTTVDIYLDLGGGFGNDTRFDFSSAINNSAGTFQRDFIFNGGFYNSADITGPGAGIDRFVISASNNSQPGSAFAKNPARSPIAISTSGWYTFEHHFYDDGGVLSADMTIRDAADTLVGSWTLNTADAIGTTGGNRYGWFDYNQFSTLAIDNASLTVVPEPTGIALLGLGAGALLLRRRRGVRNVA